VVQFADEKPLALLPVAALGFGRCMLHRRCCELGQLHQHRLVALTKLGVVYLVRKLD
jgi:hypothetical protein